MLRLQLFSCKTIYSLGNVNGFARRKNRNNVLCVEMSSKQNPLRRKQTNIQQQRQRFVSHVYVDT